MSKKHFELIARVLERFREFAESPTMYETLCIDMANELEHECKPFTSLLSGKLVGFDRARFLQACGIVEIKR